MKDRVPMYPGRVKLIPVAGQTNTFDLLRADGAVEVGTPLNKANLLKDSTAEALGLPSSAVPDDAFITLAHKTAPTLLAEFKTAGAYNWTVPAGVNKVLVAMIGGGGGSAISVSGTNHTGEISGAGGGSGEAIVFEENIASGSECSIVIGAGGRGVYDSRTYAYEFSLRGTAGNTTSIYINGKHYSVKGGDPGEAFLDVERQNGARGGQMSPSARYLLLLYPLTTTIKNELYGGVPIEFLNNPQQSYFETLSPYIINTLLSYKILPFVACTCMAVSSRYGDGRITRNNTLPNGNKAPICMLGPCVSGYTCSATKGTDPGCGGASAVGISATAGKVTTISSASGCDGGVFIYNLTGR